MPEQAVGTPREVERVDSLDHLRGLFALCVALYHLGVWTGAFTGALRVAVVVLGIYAVEGFFMLSGACFFLVYAGKSLRGGELRAFHLKRFLRIAPLYYLALFATLLLDPSYRAPFTWLRLLGNLTFSFGLSHPNHALVLGGWSIGLEYVFYLALPWLLWLTRRALWLYVAALALVVLALPFALDPLTSLVEHRRFHAYVQLPNHAFAFLLGAVIADLRGRSGFRLGGFQLGGILTSVAIGCALVAPPLVDHFEVMVGPTRLYYVAACFLVVLAFAFARSPSANSANSANSAPRTVGLGAALGWLGDRSYSLYLMHPIAWHLLAWPRRTLLAEASPALLLLTGLAGALALATLTHRLVERPAIALGKQWLAKDARKLRAKSAGVALAQAQQRKRAHEQPQRGMASL